MTLTPRIALPLAGLAALLFGAGLWSRFGGMVYFDMAAAAFTGCFF